MSSRLSLAAMPHWLLLLANIFAGAITPLSFAPYDIWPIGIISIAFFAWSLSSGSSRELFVRALAFGIGLYGTGVSWVQYSIFHFGHTSLLLSIILTALFVIAVALLFAFPFYGLGRIKPSLRLLLGFPLFWVLSEWIRTWLLTGFPWLFLGYSHLSTPLSGWAPIGGVLLISLCSTFSSSALISICNKTFSRSRRIAVVLSISIIWLSGYALKSIIWTTPAGEAISVGLVQPNIPQDLKWAPEFREPTRQRLRDLSDPLWDSDWLIWPEAALPEVHSHSSDFINKITQVAETSNTTIISGVLYDDKIQQRYFNSVMVLGDAQTPYHKQRLVPFGEYVPLENIFRGLIEFFNLPFSFLSSGPTQQNNLQIGQYHLASSICYEIVYPALVAKQAASANVLLTVSNDGWFGDSIGPIQHFHMVRMRALETGRYIIRATNNGVSAVIAPDGSIKKQSQQFIETSMQSSVVPMVGNTPYLIWRDYLVLALLILMAAIAYALGKYR